MPATVPTVPKLATIGEVARLLRTPVHRIAYILQSRPHIRVRATAGGIRCFDDEAIAQIRHELNSIAARHRRPQP